MSLYRRGRAPGECLRAARVRGRSRRRHRRGRGRDRRVGRAMENDPPNRTMLVVGNIKRAVGTDAETGRAERGLTGLFNGAGKAIGKDDEIARGLVVLERLKHDIKAALRLRRAIPRAVERDESAALIRRREGGAGIDHQIVRRPMRGKCGDRRCFLRTDADLFAAVASIFWRQHELVLKPVEITFRPAIVGAALQLDDFLSRLPRAFVCRIKVREILRELVALAFSIELK
jgi:hypothetical protein